MLARKRRRYLRRFPRPKPDPDEVLVQNAVKARSMARMMMFDSLNEGRRKYFRASGAQFDTPDSLIERVVLGCGGYFDRNRRLVIPGEERI